MKHLVLLAGAIALAIPAPLVVPDAANAQLNLGRPSQEGCKIIYAGDPVINLGECVGFVNSWWRSYEHGWVTKNCDSELELNPANFYSAYDTFAECVRDGGAAFPFPSPPG